MGNAIGIDLGTTNSAACFQNGEPRIQLSPHHEELTPSVVCCEKLDEDDDGTILVGRSAANQARLFPRNTIFSIKRLMGRPFEHENVQKLKDLANYEIVESTEPAGLAAVRMGDRVYLPEEVSALILAEIKRYSQTALSQEVTHAVITVPAYFGEPERAATREAGRKAGLVVKTLLPEPTAAALAFGVDFDTPGSFTLVFDLGGGTFDISIISIVEQDYDVMGVYGDQFLGGDDFDEEIVKMILAHVVDKYGVDMSEDPRFRIIARSEAEKAKQILSSADSARILAPQAAHVDGRDINLQLKVTREQFETAIAPYVDRCRQLVREALDDQSLTADDITDVLMVGGSTAVPMVYQAVEGIFGRDKVRRNVNPMHCVAIGAGIMAQRMKGIECPQCKQLCDESLSECPECGASLSAARSVFEGIEVTDVTTNHFGVQAVAGSDPYAFTAMVEKGTDIPMQESLTETLYTTEEGQSLIRVPVYEGVGSSVLQNSRIGVVEYPLPSELPLNHPIHVALRLDRQSLVNVVIEVENYGFRHEVKLKRELTEAFDEEEESLIEEDEEVDEEERMMAILDAAVDRVRMFVEEYEQILTPAQQHRLQRAIDEGQEVLDQDLGGKAKQAVIALDQLMVRCGTASLIEQAKLAAYAADEAVARELLDGADELKQAAESGNPALARKLSGPLASVIRQVHRKARDIEKIGPAERFGGLLRDRRGGTS